MANFNEKVLCLFSKNTQQIEKEAQRRGISTYTNVNGCKSREHMIAEIIYKDAYDCGRGNPVDATCPEGCEGKPTYKEYFFKDHEEDTTFKLSLTDKQASVFDWLLSEYILNADVFSFYPASQVKDIGRID